MTFGSLFAGIGGFDLGFERAGMQCLWQVEKDAWCRSILAKHWPHVERYEDVCDVGKHNLRTVDVICGGFPCQDVSIAGKQAGIGEGTRSGLWSQFHRIIGELRPRYAVLENVRNLLSGDNGRWFGRVLGDLAEIGIMQNGKCYQRQPLVQTTKESGFMSLPTPTHSDYKGVSSKRFVGSKHSRGSRTAEALRICLTDPIYPNPSFQALRMGFPINWVD